MLTPLKATNDVLIIHPISIHPLCCRCASETGEQPCGAFRHPSRLLDIWHQHGSPTPHAWTELLLALLRAGDSGHLLWPTMLQAMQQPLPHVGMMGVTKPILDAMRARVVAGLVEGVLEEAARAEAERQLRLGCKVRFCVSCRGT